MGEGIEEEESKTPAQRHLSRGSVGLVTRRQLLVSGMCFGVKRDERERWRKKARHKYLMERWIRLWWEDAGRREVSVEPKKENARA